MPKRNHGWPRLKPSALVAARNAKGMSQKKLSRAIGMSEGYIARIEWGHYLPPTERVQQIADILGVPVGDLLERPDNP